MKTGEQITKRNGKIEFYRFVFCVVVLLFHIQKYILVEPKIGKDIAPSLFVHGAMSCEFFFIVSGYLMASSIYKKHIKENKNNLVDGKAIANDQLSFIKKKYTDIFPQHAIAYVMAIIVYIICKSFRIKESIKFALEAIPGFFLVQMTGINFSNPNHFEWYISCMFIAMLLIYPVCRKWYYVFTRYYSWIIASLIFGYLIYKNGCLTGVSAWEGLCYRSLLRAIGDISIGTTAFELSRYISEKELSSVKKAMLSMVEVIFFFMTIMLMMFTFPRKYQIYILVCMFIVVTIAFSGVTYGARAYNKPFFNFLGKLSLPIYLGQLPAINLVMSFFTDNYSKTQQAFLVIILNMIFAVAIFILNEIYRSVKKHLSSLT